jgi:hypothetical protein
MTDTERDLVLKMAKLIRSMSLEIRFHRKQGAGEPPQFPPLEKTPGYSPLATHFDALLLPLEKKEVSTTAEEDKQVCTSLEKILKLADEVANR